MSLDRNKRALPAIQADAQNIQNIRIEPADEAAPPFRQGQRMRCCASLGQQLFVLQALDDLTDSLRRNAQQLDELIWRCGIPPGNRT